MRGIVSAAGYVPYNRLQRARITEVVGLDRPDDRDDSWFDDHQPATQDPSRRHRLLDGQRVGERPDRRRAAPAIEQPVVGRANAGVEVGDAVV